MANQPEVIPTAKAAPVDLSNQRVPLYFVSRFDLSEQTVRSLLKIENENRPLLAGIDVVGSARSIVDAQKKIPMIFSGVALLLIDVMSLETLSLLKSFIRQRSNVSVVIMTDEAAFHYPAQCYQLGVLGLVSRESDLGEVLKAIGYASQGRRYVSRSVSLAYQVGKSAGNIIDNFQQLSERERQVMLGVAAGEGIRELAERLSLSPKTVSTYRYRLFDKMSVSNDVQLALLAHRAGLAVATATPLPNR